MKITLVVNGQSHGFWEVVPYDDGCVRVAKVKTASTVATHAKKQRRGEVKTSTVVLTRPVTSLCRLEMED